MVCVTAPGVVELREVPIPTAGPSQLLVRVQACGFDYPVDGPFFQTDCPGPFPLPAEGQEWGHEGTGVIEALGPEVTGFEVGQRVGYFGPGFAEYGLVDVTRAVPLPSDLEPALALAEPLAVCANTIDHTNPQPGEIITVVGAGFMGLLITQMLRDAGLARLIVLEPRAERRALAAELGATDCFDASGPDVAGEVLATCGEVDKCIEASGVAAGLALADALIKPTGTLIIHSYYFKGATADLPLWHTKEVTAINSHPSSDARMLPPMQRGLQMLADGKLDLDCLVTHRLLPEELGCVPSLVNQPDFIKAVCVFE